MLSKGAEYLNTDGMINLVACAGSIDSQRLFIGDQGLKRSQLNGALPKDFISQQATRVP